MRHAWRQLKVRDVCELINGRAYNKSELLPLGKYPVLRVGNFFTNNHWYYSDLELEDRKYADSGDLLYAWSASFGPRIWTGDKVIFHYHIWKVVPDPALIDQSYLFYFLLWDAELIKEEKGTGTTMIHVSKGSMEARDIRIPPLMDQQRIVGILDEAFEGIATAKANAEKSLKNARAIFDTYLEAVFTQRGKGWRDESLGKLASFRNGINYTQESKGERVKVVGVRNFRANFTAPLDDLDTVTIHGDLSETDTLKRNDILVVRSNGNIDLIGRTMLVGDVNEKTSHSGFTIRIRLESGDLSQRYLCHFMKSAATRRRLTDAGTGTNIKSLNQGTLATLRVSFPPLHEQQLLVEMLERVAEESRCLESVYRQKLAALDSLKKSLLHEAFSGNL